MSIYISKNNHRLGPFVEAKVREMLENGQISPDDLAIREGEIQWVKLAEMFPRQADSQVSLPPAAPDKSRKGRKGLLLGCGGFFVVLLLAAFVLSWLAYLNMNPADSVKYLPAAVKDFKLVVCYPPKGNIWGTEKMFSGIYTDKAKAKTVIYMMTIYSSETAASDVLRRELASSCRAGETPMYFKFVKNGAETSQGATCALPFFVQKDNRLVTIGGAGAGAEDFIEFAENLPFNAGAEMIKK